MAIGFGWDDNDEDKYKFWMEFEKLFRKFYTPEEIATGVSFPISKTTKQKYNKMNKWVKALSSAIGDSRDEIFITLFKGK